MHSDAPFHSHMGATERFKTSISVYVVVVCCVTFLLVRVPSDYLAFSAYQDIITIQSIPCQSWRPSSEYLDEGWYHAQVDYSQFRDFGVSRRNLACPPSFASGAWNRILHRLVTTQIFKIVVMGGSETAGIECEDGTLRGKACAWSARLVEIMERAFPAKEIRLYNVASGGTTITAALASLSVWTRTPADSDLLLVDFIVNDSYENVDNLFSAYEHLIITIQKLRPDLEIAFINTCSLSRCHRVNDMIKLIAGHYDIPVVSYADLALGLSEISGQADLPTVYWGGKEWVHPPWFIHQLIGETVWGCIQQHWDEKCDRSRGFETGLKAILSLEKSFEDLDVCDVPISQYSAFSPPSTSVPNHRWELTEDRPGKPGWISTSYSSAISYNLTFGIHPRLVLTYLKSYSGLGTAEMWFSSIPDRKLTLHGLYRPDDPQYGTNTSQSFLLILNVEQQDFYPEYAGAGISGIVGFNIPPFSNETLNFRILGPDAAETNSQSAKFKLITVQTC